MAPSRDREAAVGARPIQSVDLFFGAARAFLKLAAYIECARLLAWGFTFRRRREREREQTMRRKAGEES